MIKEFWRGRKVFITGHTGFKGTWLTLTLQKLGAEVSGFSLGPPTVPSMFELCNVADSMKNNNIGDIRNIEELSSAIKCFQPEVCFHLAAQPLVRQSYKDPIETYSTNVMGTLNVLLSLQESKAIKSIVCITTDKCYDNKEWCWPYRESDSLGGHDPYSSSKACAEILSSSIRNSFYKEKEINLATVRAGNVIGGGDWADDRIIPDLVRAFEKKEKLRIRNPGATRPWQHVMEPVLGYLTLAEKLYTDSSFSEAFNFGPEEKDCLMVETVTEIILKSWENHPGVEVVGDSKKLHEANILKLDCSKSKHRLGWKPRMSLQESLQLTSSWYQHYFNNGDLLELTMKQIEIFMDDSKPNNQ